RARCDTGHDGVHHRAGIRAVADVVTEKDMACDAARLRVGETGRKRLAIGMDIRQQSREQRTPPQSTGAKSKRISLRVPCARSSARYLGQRPSGRGTKKSAPLKAGRTRMLWRLAGSDQVVRPWIATPEPSTMSTPLVSRRKTSPTMTVMIATPIG